MVILNGNGLTAWTLISRTLFDELFV
jgi:hypothetical protein